MISEKKYENFDFLNKIGSDQFKIKKTQFFSKQMK